MLVKNTNDNSKNEGQDGKNMMLFHYNKKFGGSFRIQEVFICKYPKTR